MSFFPVCCCKCRDICTGQMYNIFLTRQNLLEILYNLHSDKYWVLSLISLRLNAPLCSSKWMMYKHFLSLDLGGDDYLSFSIFLPNLNTSMRQLVHIHLLYIHVLWKFPIERVLSRTLVFYIYVDSHHFLFCNSFFLLCIFFNFIERAFDEVFQIVNGCMSKQ